jgi:hypothetical protein
MIPPDKADPYRMVTIEVQAGRVADIVIKAIAMAAEFLQEDPDDLYAAEVGNATVIRRSRYRPHLGVQGAPIRWAATVKVRLRPEIVRARRGFEPEEPPTPPDSRPPKGSMQNPRIRLATRGGEPVKE